MNDPCLPSTWTSVALADLAAPEPNAITDGPFGSKLKTEHYTASGPRVVRLQNIGDGFFCDERAHISEEHFATLQKHRVLPGDLLIAALGERLPRACLAPATLGPAIVKADCIRFRPNQALVSAKYLQYALISPQVRHAAGAIIHGVGRPRLNQSEIKSLPIPLAPRVQRDRIVAEIEKQFTRLDAGVEALRRLGAHLRRYRAAVLKASCDGTLVVPEAELSRREGRSFQSGEELLQGILRQRRRLHDETSTTNRSRYREPVPPGPQTTAIPEGWTWATVEQLSSVVTYGSSAKTGAAATGVPVLRMGNISGGVLDTGKLKYLPQEHDEFPELLLRDGDVLFNRTNSAELVGKTAVYEGHPSPCSFASYLVRVRLLDGYSPHLLSAFINSVYGREWVKKVVVQQVGQANVNGSKLQALAVPVPPAAEQARIVTELSQRLAEVAVTQGMLNRALGRADRLRASVLHAAFDGRLVPSGGAERAPAML